MINHEEILNDQSLSDRTLLTIKRHPMGLVPQSVAFILGIGLSGFVLLESSTYASDHGIPAAMLAALFLLIGLVSVVMLAGMIYLYSMSMLLVSERDITQIVQKGIFNKKVSKLSMSSVEDVTYSQKGVFASMFNYGTLIVETAGEQQNFVFKYATDTKTAANVVLAAHERYLQLSLADGRNQVMAKVLG